MKVWRIQHDCHGGFGHGPVYAGPGRCSLPDYGYGGPSYGTRLETPHSDPLLDYHIESYERVGTLAEQFPRWWSRSWVLSGSEMVVSNEPDELPEDWYAVLYEVPDEYVRVGTNQVLFQMDHAEMIYFTQTDFPRAKDYELVTA